MVLFVILLAPGCRLTTLLDWRFNARSKTLLHPGVEQQPVPTAGAGKAPSPSTAPLMSREAEEPPEFKPQAARELTRFFAPLDSATLPPKPVPSPLTKATTDEGAGRRFGDYVLLAEIARGGMGVVFRPASESQPRCRPQDDSGGRAGCERRSAALSAGSRGGCSGWITPNIVPIYEVGLQDGQQYFSMKLIEGPSLAASRRF